MAPRNPLHPGAQVSEHLVGSPGPPMAHARLLIDNLAAVEDALAGGAIVSLSPTRLRVRALPIHDNPRS